MLNIVPIKHCSIENLIEQSMSQVVYKNCMTCLRNAEHDETLRWVCLPNYLVLAVNRFNYVGNRTIKNNTCIPLQTHVTMDGAKFTLVGIVHHHGSGASSGHYTSTLFHDDSVFQCNDMMITESSKLEFAHSATSYILVYKLNT